jgi:hypothetical protein
MEGRRQLAKEWHGHANHGTPTRGSPQERCTRARHVARKQREVDRLPDDDGGGQPMQSTLNGRLARWRRGCEVPTPPAAVAAWGRLTLQVNANDRRVAGVSRTHARTHALSWDNVKSDGDVVIVSFATPHERHDAEVRSSKDSLLRWLAHPTKSSGVIGRSNVKSRANRAASQPVTLITIVTMVMTVHDCDNTIMRAVR